MILWYLPGRPPFPTAVGFFHPCITAGFCTPRLQTRSTPYIILPSIVDYVDAQRIPPPTGLQSKKSGIHPFTLTPRWLKWILFYRRACLHWRRIQSPSVFPFFFFLLPRLSPDEAGGARGSSGKTTSYSNRAWQVSCFYGLWSTCRGRG